MSKALELARIQLKTGWLSFQMDLAAQELQRLAAIEQAATTLIKCKGRYHAELNTKALAVALGLALPQVDDINVVDLNRPSAIELQNSEIGIPEPVTELINPAPTGPFTRTQALAWLVENVKVWPNNQTAKQDSLPNGCKWYPHFIYGITFGYKEGEELIFQSDWLAAQPVPASNKPSWDDAPTQAKILVQQDNGTWLFSAASWATTNNHGGWCCSFDGSWILPGFFDAPNPSWRDTLEYRPTANNISE
jgi:hypothetical protein